MLKELVGLRRELAYVATANGIFTETGIWYQATEDALKAYAGEVLDVRPLPVLLSDADVWLRSPQALALWLLPLFLLMLSPLPAALAALTVFAGWSILGPSFVNVLMRPFLRVVDHVILQGLYYVLILSMMAAAGYFSGMWVGIGGFVALRWGIVQRLLDPLLRPAQHSLYSLPLPDQVLRSVILRTALRRRISLPHIDEMERRIRSRWEKK